MGLRGLRTLIFSLVQILCCIASAAHAQITIDGGVLVI
jgi:hypothetical protein